MSANRDPVLVGDPPRVADSDRRRAHWKIRLAQTAARALERVAIAEIPIGNRSLTSFQLWVGIGAIAATALATILTAVAERPLGLVPALLAVGVLACLGLALLDKALHGRERLIYYREAGAALGAIALALWIAGEPLLPWMDVAVLCIGLLGAMGRIGCLMVGCCHGTPCSWGIRYGRPHAACGFTKYYVGVPLFPVQAGESILQLVGVAVGVALVLRGAAPGSALTWYAVVYGSGRFVLETRRGDPLRRYLWGLSTGQWTSLAIVCVAAGLGLQGTLPGQPWHPVAALLLLTAAAAVLARTATHGTRDRDLLRPDHLGEVAAIADDLLRQPADRGYVSRSSLGLKLSLGPIEHESGTLLHFAMSRDGQPLGHSTARRLSDIIQRMSDRPGELIDGQDGVRHLLLRPRPEGQHSAVLADTPSGRPTAPGTAHRP